MPPVIELQPVDRVRVDDPDGQRHRSADPRPGSGHAAQLAQGAGRRRSARRDARSRPSGVPDALDRRAGLLGARASREERAGAHAALRHRASRRPAWSRTCAGSASRWATSRRSCSATATGITSRGWRAWPGRSGARNLPVLIHPEFWTRRRISFPGVDPAELPSTSRAALEGAGFEIVEERQPSFLLDGSRARSPARSTGRPSSRPASRATRRSATATGSPIR